MQSIYKPLLIAAVATLVVTISIAGRIAQFRFPLPRRDKRLGCLDGLRGYLALSVLVYHFCIWVGIVKFGSGWTQPTANLFAQMGAGAVGLFFMTTGMVFYPHILRGFAATPWMSLLVTRVFRIIPLVTVSVAVITLIIAIRTSTRPDLDYIAAVAQWISGWSQPPLLDYPNSDWLNARVLWSLWYEWLFYLVILPVSAWTMDLLKNWELPTWLVPTLVIAIGVAGRIVIMPKVKGTDFFMYLPLFAVGMLSHEIQARSRFRLFFQRRAIAAISVIFLIISMIVTRNPYGFSLPLFSLFFICVACGNSFFGTFTLRGALVLGECSFGIYILHGIILEISFTSYYVFNIFNNGFMLYVFLPVIGSVAFLVSLVSYMVIERPAIEIGKLLARRIDKRAQHFHTIELEVTP